MTDLTERKCEDCKWYRVLDKCDHGYRHSNISSHERANGHCGKEGKLWEMKN